MRCGPAQELFIRLLLVAAMSWTLPGAAGAPQTETAAAPSQTSEQKKKTKKVWTEDDLRRIRRAGVSVVGETPPAKNESTAKAGPDEEEAEEAALSSEPEPAPEPARPPCMSRSWGAGVEIVLAAQGVSLGTDYWVLKCYGGDVCTTQVGSVPALVRSVEGDYTLDDGTRVRIQARTWGGFPEGGSMVDTQEQGREYLVVWKKHPYVTAGYKGVKRIVWTDGVSYVDYVLDTVKLVDPYEGRQVTFSTKKDRFEDIDAVVELVVSKR